MVRFLLVCLGGAIGSGARYLISGWMLMMLGATFPWGTLLVNAVGSFLICGVMHLGVAAKLISPTLLLFLTTGVMGGFTTYSTFDYDTFRFTQTGAYGLAALNVAATLAVCFAAGWAGDAVVRAITR